MTSSDRPWQATYRLQLNARFTFRDVEAIAPYLAGLGVSHVYFSPILAAVPGSNHGYDGIDPTRISEELGGEAAYRQMTATLQHFGIGQIVDIVPNHLAASPLNPWWWDVLRQGRQSPYASFFDLRWHAAPDDSSTEVICLPVLGEDLETTLRRGELTVEESPDGLLLRYFDHAFPLSRNAETPSLQALNADPVLLLALLRRQAYRLVDWRSAARHIDYRRFFNINGLVSLRVEEPDVFDAAHDKVLELLTDGAVSGLRIDHIDGLRDPAAYLGRLRALAPQARIVVEKILEGEEELPPRWPVDGTTGYEFLNAVNGLFVDSAAEERLTDLYRELTGEPAAYEAVLQDCKRSVLDDLFAGDLNHLVSLFVKAWPKARWARDAIATALSELIVALPVYRTYVSPDGSALSSVDRRVLAGALAALPERCPGLDPTLHAALSELLLLGRSGTAATNFLLSLQQLSGPAMAKGAEDTAFYRDNRLVSLNEVGGDPGRFGGSLAAFHALCTRYAEHWPLTMLTTSTHDTKRGEDVRLRIDAISQLPGEWEDQVRRWMQAHEGYRTAGLPDANIAYMLYQTLAGSWPIETARVQEYMLKAAREAKRFTTWTDPDSAYEQALQGYVSRVLGDETFVAECASLAGRLAAIARLSSLSQTLLKLAAPGVPDLYQGSETWEMSLVDPDNRRPVDFAKRHRLLDEVRDLAAADTLQRMEEGVPKLWLIRRTLALRRRRPELFAGSYTPLRASGPSGENVVAFLRNDSLLAVAPRLVSGLGETYGGAALTLPQGRWRNELTAEDVPGGEQAVATLLRDFPVALLSRQAST